MSRTLRQWLSSSGGATAWDGVKRWCAGEGLVLKVTHEQDGFVIEPSDERLAVRIEWGPSQRRYLPGMELRLRGSTGIDPMAYAALMPAAQIEQLEEALFAQSTTDVQTRFDDEMPEEVRWLAVGERLSTEQLGPLREHFSAVANVAEWMAQWLAGPTGPALQQWVHQREAARAPLPACALLTQRGRLAWRQVMPMPDAAAIAQARDFFTVALREARLFATEPGQATGPLTSSGVSRLPRPDDRDPPPSKL